MQIILFGLLLMAWLLRLAYVLSLPDQLIWSDEKDYYRLGQSLSQGQGFVQINGQATAIRAVGYPMFLALLRWLGVTSLLGIRVVQSILSTATLWLLYLFLRILCEKSPWPLAAVGVGALYPYFIYLPGTVLATTLFCFLLVASVYFLFRALYLSEPFSLAIAGVFSGLASLAVATGLVLAAMTLLWLLGQRAGLKRLSLYGLGLSLMLLPWLSRNVVKLELWNLASSGGYNFWLGNNAQAQIDLPGLILPSPELQQKLDAAGSEKEQDRLYTTAALEWITQSRERFVSLTIRKAAYFWRLSPSPVTRSYLQQSAVIRWLGTVSFTVMLFLAMLGYAKLPGEWKPARILWLLYFISFTIVHSLTIVKVRFRLPLDHFILLLSAYGLIYLLGRLRAFRHPSLTGWSRDQGHPAGNRSPFVVSRKTLL